MVTEFHDLVDGFDSRYDLNMTAKLNEEPDFSGITMQFANRILCSQSVTSICVRVLILGILFRSVCATATDKASSAAIADVLKDSKKAIEATDFKGLAIRLLQIADAAAKGDNFTDAEKAMKFAADFAQKSGKNQILHRVGQKTEEVKTLGREYKTIAGAIKRLASNPNDASANRAVGLFRSAGQEQWSVGAAFLEKSGDERLIAIAKGEIAESMSIADELALGEKWKEAAESESKWLQQQMYRRAHHWYAKAFRATPEGQERETLRDRMMKELPIMYLSDMQEEIVADGGWAYAKYGRDGAIKIDGEKYDLGISMHPLGDGSFRVRFKLNGNYRTLNTGCGLCDSNNAFSGSKIHFVIWGDGKPIWKSSPFRNRKDAEFSNINVKGVQTLEIRTECEGLGFGGDAVWLDPFLLK